MTALQPAISASSSLGRRISTAAAAGSDLYFDSETDPRGSGVCDVAFSSSAEHPSVSSRCSVRLLHEIISKFCPQKVQLVRSIGFEGVLHIPLLKQINLRFSTWLMSRVDELSNSLLISDGSCIEFNKHDVARVFGIPSGGSSIFYNPGKIQMFSIEQSGSGLSSEAPHYRSIKAAQGIVSRQVEGPMNPVEQDEFTAAFVVFVMSTLLAPSARHDRVSDDYLHAIQNPSKISSYDWAEYVLRRLLDAVGKLKIDIANNVKAPYIHGCSLFLQVLYLDSIDLGSLSMPHDEFPHIRCFTSDRLRAMIAADPSFNPNCYNVHECFKAELRDSGGVCYHWARSQAAQCSLPPQESHLLSLWQFSLTMTRVLKIAPEAAGPLFIAASGCPEALKFMDVLLHLIEPYMNGFSYRPSFSLKSRPFVRSKRKLSPVNGEGSSSGNRFSSSTKRHHGASVGWSFYVGIGSRMMTGMGYVESVVDGDAVAGNLLSEDVDIQAICSMARFYLELTPVKPTRCSDLNQSPLHDDSGFIVPPSECSWNHDPARTPWQIGYRWSLDSTLSYDVMKKLCLVDEIDEPWIAHFCPKYIEVTTRALKEQFLGHTEFELEMVDAAIHRFKQIDDELYANEGSARWRHYVEFDFMVSLLAGSFNIMDPVQRSHFCGRHIKYDVTSCRMLIFPVILQYRWACFAWRMEDNTIVVYDPCSYVSPQSDLIKTYARVAKLLKAAMVMVSSCMMDGWSYDWQDARIEVFKQGNAHYHRWNRSGLMCLHFCRCFDGSETSPSLDWSQIDALAGTILVEVSELSCNLGVVPKSISQSIVKETHFEV